MKFKIILPKFSINNISLKSLILGLIFLLIGGGIHFYKYKTKILNRVNKLVATFTEEAAPIPTDSSDEKVTVEKSNKSSTETKVNIQAITDTDFAIVQIIKSEDIPYLVAKEKVIAKASTKNYYRLAVSSYNKKKYPAAIEYFKKVLEFSKLKSEYNFNSNLKLAELFNISGNYKETVYYYKRALLQQPDDYRIYHSLGVTYLKWDKPNSAIEYFNKALSVKSGFPEAYIGKSNAYLKLNGKKNIKKAIEVYDESINIVVDNVKINEKNDKLNYNYALLLFKYAFDLNKSDYKIIKKYFETAYNNSNNRKIKELSSYYLAKVLIKLNKKDLAINSINNALKFNNSNINYYLLKGDLFYELNEKPSTLVSFYNQIVKKISNNPVLYNRLADSLFKKHLYKRAEDFYKSSLKINSNNLSANFGLARIYYKQNFYNSSYNHLSEILRLYNNENIIDNKTKINDILKDSYCYLASILFEHLKEYKKSLKCYENALKLIENPNKKAYIFYNIGLIYEKLNKPDKAINNYLKAINVERENYKFNKAISTVYYKQRRFANAIDYIIKTLEKQPNDDEVLFMYAFALYERGNFERSLTIFEKAIKYSNNKEILNASYKNIGNIYYYRALEDRKTNNTKEFDKKINIAIDNFKKAIKFNSKDHTSYYNSGLCYFQKGEYNNSIFYIKSAIKINPNISKYHSTLGNCYFEKGLLNLAEKAFKKAIELDASNIEAQYNLTQIKE